LVFSPADRADSAFVAGVFDGFPKRVLVVKRQSKVISAQHIDELHEPFSNVCHTLTLLHCDHVVSDRSTVTNSDLVVIKESLQHFFTLNLRAAADL
jgi:hypothetical protein